jgi:uncharacterized ferritin-like protein (DUF455 family)
MSLKVGLAHHLHTAMERATQLRARVVGLTRATAEDLPVRQGCQTVMKHLDEAPEVTVLLAGFIRILRSLIALYKHHLETTDIVGDAESNRLISAVLPGVTSTLVYLSEALQNTPSTSDLTAFTEKTDALWNSRESGSSLLFRDSIWLPITRVRAVARPDGLNRCEPGSLGLMTIDPVGDREDVAKFLHADLDEEYTTLELMARNSYEHPDMPWQFHVDMTRQVADEARHAVMMLNLLESRGFHYGDFDIYTGSYEGLYEFGPCDAGSRKELLWRMLIRQTFMEGLALDSLADNIPKRAAADQHDIAHALDYILRDEVFHVQSGTRWSAYLIGEDHRAMLQERYEAITWFTKAAEAVRVKFAEKNPEKAMAELVTIQEGKRRRGGKRPDRPLNRIGRLQAGQNEDDILQVLSWGYATEKPASG